MSSLRKSVSVTEIARLVGVSHAAVSMVLNPPNGKASPIGEDCARRIRETAKRLGYVPNYHAQAMKRGRAGVIGVVMDVDFDDPIGATDPRATQLGLPYFGTLVGAIELYTRRRGSFTTIVGPDRKSTALERGFLSLRQRQFDGLILRGTGVAALSVDSRKKTGREPVIVVEPGEPTPFLTVDWDETAGISLAVKHLAELGHRRVLWLGPGSKAEDKSPIQREKAFMAAIGKAGLRGASCQFAGSDAGYFGPTVEAASTALQQYMREQGNAFTAVVAYNDMVAIGAYGALTKAGRRIPTDVSVIGFDNIVAPLAVPSLTTIDHKLAEMGRRASELLFEMIEDERAIKRLRGKREVLMPELVARESTASPRRK